MNSMGFPYRQICWRLLRYIKNDNWIVFWNAFYISKEPKLLEKLLLYDALKKCISWVIAFLKAVIYPEMLTWQLYIFYKNPIICNQTNLKVCCIDTGRTGMSYLNNKLILVNHDAQVKSIVARSISESWPKGLEKEEEKNISNTDLHYFVLRGYWGGTHEDGINTRLLLCNLVGNMAAHHWRLLCFHQHGRWQRYIFLRLRRDVFCITTRTSSL